MKNSDKKIQRKFKERHIRNRTRNRKATFYRSNDEAYRDAWNKLNQCFGQPFVIQRAFRDKLSKWPKIQSKDAEGLRTFSDFLNTCQQAMPYVKGLEILSD